jgi:hypothetical protein
MTPRGQAKVTRSPLHEGRFGRMFRKLQACKHYEEAELTQLAELMREQEGGAGGWGQPDVQPQGGDNPDIASAFTYFGQFLDHDITFDASSRLQVLNDLDALVDFRTPRFDLDSLYGSGPVDEPFQYDQQNAGRLLVGDNGQSEKDLPRNPQGVALIGDPRNDENVIVSGLQILMLLFHNKLAGEVDADQAIQPENRFDETRKRVRFHYQWVVVNDYLPRICGADLVKSLLKIEDDGDVTWRLRFYTPKKNAYMPIEFAAAAFRFGHSQVRSGYILNDTIGSKPIFVAGDDQGPGADLRGGQPPLPQWTVGWEHFIKLDDTAPAPSRLIDAKISPALFDLPRFPTDTPQSLPLRNLIRGQDKDLPSGQDVAKAVGAKPMTGADLGGVLDPTPLWFYILKESELIAGGRTLGPTGARVVAETLLGMLRTDPSSYVNLDPLWKPTVAGGSAPDGTFGLADLIQFART